MNDKVGSIGRKGNDNGARTSTESVLQKRGCNESTHGGEPCNVLVKRS